MYLSKAISHYIFMQNHFFYTPHFLFEAESHAQRAAGHVLCAVADIPATLNTNLERSRQYLTSGKKVTFEG